MRITKKKIAAVVATTAVVALGSTAAYAYFTTGGTGTGSATTANATALTITGSAAVGLYPGGTEPITYSIHNPATFPQHIIGVAVSLPTFSVHPNDVAQPDCTNADFTVSQPAATNGEVAPGTTTVTSGSITMIDTNADQNNCQTGVSHFAVPLNFTVS